MNRRVDWGPCWSLGCGVGWDGVQEEEPGRVEVYRWCFHGRFQRVILPDVHKYQSVQLPPQKRTSHIVNLVKP